MASQVRILPPATLFFPLTRKEPYKAKGFVRPPRAKVWKEALTEKKGVCFADTKRKALAEKKSVGFAKRLNGKKEKKLLNEVEQALFGGNYSL